MNAIEQAQVLMEQLARERFFGTVTFQFQDGRITLIRKEQTIVPNGNTGGRNVLGTDQSK